MRFKLDTGAECNVLTVEVYQTITTEKLKRCKDTLHVFNNSRMNLCGKAKLAIEQKSKITLAEFLVVEVDVPCILGVDTCAELGLEKRINTINLHTLS